MTPLFYSADRALRSKEAVALDASILEPLMPENELLEAALGWAGVENYYRYAQRPDDWYNLFWNTTLDELFQLIKDVGWCVPEPENLSDLASEFAQKHFPRRRHALTQMLSNLSALHIMNSSQESEDFSPMFRAWLTSIWRMARLSTRCQWRKTMGEWEYAAVYWADGSGREFEAVKTFADGREANCHPRRRRRVA